MPRKNTDTQPLHTRLLDGFTYTSRANGSVHTIKAGKTTVGEVVIGKKTVRLNLRAKGHVPKDLKLSGKSRSWPMGGVLITEANLAAARALLSSIASAKPATPKTPAPRKATMPRTRSSRKVRSAA
jgi:hypothetical protein